MNLKDHDAAMFIAILAHHNLNYSAHCTPFGRITGRRGPNALWDTTEGGCLDLLLTPLTPIERFRAEIVIC